MCDQWMPALKLPLTLEQFQQLPRNSAYKYEYLNGIACLSPRAKAYHATLDLASYQPQRDHAPPTGFGLRRLRKRDLPALVPLFAAAFHDLQPFGSLDDATRLRAAQECLSRTCADADGPLIRVASHIATREDKPVGAILITLMPDGDPCDWGACHWPEPPPPDLLKRRRGQPHVTWIFVSPWHKGSGFGTALLGAAVGTLRKLGYQALLSTFFSANESSMLWHWRCGFKLLAYPGSKGRMRPWIEEVNADLTT